MRWACSSHRATQRHGGESPPSPSPQSPESQPRPPASAYPEKCLMRRSEMPCHVSTYVRRLASVGVSSTVFPPIPSAQRMLKRDRSDVALIASGVYISIHTH